MRAFLYNVPNMAGKGYKLKGPNECSSSEHLETHRSNDRIGRGLQRRACVKQARIHRLQGRVNILNSIKA